MAVSDYTPEQKVAIVILSIGPEKAAKIFENLTPAEIDKITVAISELGVVDPADKEEILKEFFNEVNTVRGGVAGGSSTAKKILEASLGREASDYLSRLKLSEGGESDISGMLQSVDINQLINFIRGEHPQTIALILTNMEPSKAAEVISALPEEMQVEVMLRIANMDQTDPEVVKQIGEVIKRQLTSTYGKTTKSAGGAKSVAEVLNYVDRGTEKNIIAAMEERNAELAEEVKKLMFVFEDIIYVEDRSMQKVLKEIDTSELALALKSASDEVKEKIFKNVSKRAAALIKEEIEYMGPVRLRDVEEAQQRIVNIVRRLEEEGEIVISGRGGKGDEIIV